MEITFELPKTLTKEGFEAGYPKGEPIVIEELGWLIHFIRKHFQKQEYFNYKCSSYGLKHLVERCFKNKIHVSNGEFIAAMMLCGYRYKKVSDNSPNCRFNIKKVNEKKIKQELSLIN